MPDFLSPYATRKQFATNIPTANPGDNTPWVHNSGAVVIGPYAGPAIADVQGLQGALDGKVAKAGDTMTGDLTLNSGGTYNSIVFGSTGNTLVRSQLNALQHFAESHSFYGPGGTNAPFNVIGTLNAGSTNDLQTHKLSNLHVVSGNSNDVYISALNNAGSLLGFGSNVHARHKLTFGPAYLTGDRLEVNQNAGTSQILGYGTAVNLTAGHSTATAVTLGLMGYGTTPGAFVLEGNRIGWFPATGFGSAPDAFFSKYTTGPAIQVNAAGGLRVRDLAGTADAPITAGQATLNRSAFASYGNYLEAKNESGYTEVAIQQGQFAGYGGSITLYPGDATNADYVRLQYSGAYPKFQTSRNNFTFIGTGFQQRFSNAYVDWMMGSTYVLSLNNGSPGMILRNDYGMTVRNAADNAYADVAANAFYTNPANATGIRGDKISTNTGQRIDLMAAGNEVMQIRTNQALMVKPLVFGAAAFWENGDVGLDRNAAGVLEINNGIATASVGGEYRDLKARAGTFSDDITMTADKRIGTSSNYFLPRANSYRHYAGTVLVEEVSGSDFTIQPNQTFNVRTGSTTRLSINATGSTTFTGALNANHSATIDAVSSMQHALTIKATGAANAIQVLDNLNNVKWSVTAGGQMTIPALGYIGFPHGSQIGDPQQIITAGGAGIGIKTDGGFYVATGGTASRFEISSTGGVSVLGSGNGISMPTNSFIGISNTYGVAFGNTVTLKSGDGILSNQFGQFTWTDENGVTTASLSTVGVGGAQGDFRLHTGRLGIGTAPSSYAGWGTGSKMLHIYDATTHLPHVRLQNATQSALFGLDNSSVYVGCTQANFVVNLPNGSWRARNEPSTQQIRQQVYDSTLAAWQETERHEATPTGPLWGVFGNGVAQQTGGALSAGATYTANEQTMINSMWTAMRNYGLLN